MRHTWKNILPLEKWEKWAVDGKAMRDLHDKIAPWRTF